MRILKICSIVVFIFGALFTAGINAHGHEEVISGQKENAANKMTYATHIKPIFQERCSECHGAKSPEHQEFKKDEDRYKKEFVGPRMDGYTYMISFVAWPDTGAIMRRLDDGQNTKDGKPGNMYKHLGRTEEERQKNLAIFKEWVGNWTLKRWPEISKEELDRIKVKY